MEPVRPVLHAIAPTSLLGALLATLVATGPACAGDAAWLVEQGVGQLEVLAVVGVFTFLIVALVLSVVRRRERNDD